MKWNYEKLVTKSRAQWYTNIGRDKTHSDPFVFIWNLCIWLADWIHCLYDELCKDYSAMMDVKALLNSESKIFKTEWS